MIRVFPRKTKWTPDDDLSFIGDPPNFFKPDEQPVMVSCTFTYDIPEAIRLKNAWSVQYMNVKIGGPAFGDPGGQFEPDMFVKSGVTITSRGCIRRCPWCLVPEREGKIRELDIKPGHIIQDNNILACSRSHIESVFDMLSNQKKSASFNGGIDTRLLMPWHRSLFEAIRINEIWVACDSIGSIRHLDRSLDIIGFLPRKKRRCYVMIGFDSEPYEMAKRRLETVYSMGFMPFCQLYQPSGGKTYYSEKWRLLAKKWSRPAAYESIYKKKDHQKQLSIFGNSQRNILDS